MNSEAAQAQRSIFEPRILIPFIIVTLIWGSTWIVIKDQLGVVPPSWSVTWRFLLGGLTMLAVAMISRNSLKLDRSGLVFVALFGIAQFVFNFNFVYRAEQFITSGLVAVVFALLFLPNAIFSRLFLGTRFSLRFVIGSAIALFGISLLFVNEAQGGQRAVGDTVAGIGFTLCAVLSASAANVMQASERARRLPMATMLGWGMVIGALLDAMLAYAISGPPAFEARPGYVFGLLYLGIMASAVAFSLYFRNVRDLGPARAAYSSVLIPVIAMAFSTVFEGYQWSGLAITGSVVTLLGMLIALSRR